MVEAQIWEGSPRLGRDQSGRLPNFTAETWSRHVAAESNGIDAGPRKGCLDRGIFTCVRVCADCGRTCELLGAPERSAFSSLTREFAVVTAMTDNDGVEILCKDLGSKHAQSIVFHHGWPLPSDDWDNRMLFFLGKGCRALDIDGHGRSTQVSEGHDMDDRCSSRRRASRSAQHGPHRPSHRGSHAMTPCPFGAS